MSPEDPFAKETDADEWYSDRILSAEFDEIPATTETFEIDVPEDVESFVRERYDDIAARGEEPDMTALLLEHIDLDPVFVLEGEVPDGEPGVKRAAGADR